MKKIFTLLIIICFYSCNKENNSQKAVRNEIANGITSKKDSLTVITVPTSTRPGKISNLVSGCGYNYKAIQREVVLTNPSTREIDQLKNILSYTGIPMNFEFFSANISNAVATNIKDHRFIIYDPDLFKYVDKTSNSYWSSMSILAHEIGHHLSGHTLNSDQSNSLKSELEADKFSGFLLYKMGATLEESTLAISKLGSEKDSNSHPSKYKRIIAIKEGWTEAQNQRHTNVIPPPPADDQDLCEYDYKSLIDVDLIGPREDLIYKEEDYKKYNFFEGVILDVDFDDKSKKTVESFDILIKKTGKSWHTNADGSVFKISLDNYRNSEEISTYCYFNLPNLITPGRRLKFAFVEGAGFGTVENGLLRLTYANALPGNSY